MGKELDEFVIELQNQINEEMEAAYGPVALERWLNPRYVGRLENPDGYARLRGSCGDTMEVFLRFEKDRVLESAFQTDGCGASSVCGSFAAEMALGKGPEELLEITGVSILEKIGGLPKEEEHCAFLASETLQEALNDYMIKNSKK
jgi:nitrogen fixation NifU-like protein